ncbi:hypothetical protein LTR70_002420 [Exophiala xenobiotica]|uniref:RBR-type E3 ubiquitin transferase n=1 Tax=Lithohypha guttulata TaxID=1690604 RepID=A0ABR0KKV6_9EURO|nr:hypothetical protein LTR24_001417 [Lithohypha guttulata]KAK5325448.1 hypothetical protein LTR70_002420 [Exophiala xenobiotica]
MAQQEVQADSRRRKHRRRHHHEPSDDTPPQPAGDAFEQPTDIAALREARLKSMATPITARQKMKIEYQYSRPVKVQTQTTTTTKAKSVAASSGLFGRRTSVLSARTKKSKDDGYQSVYNTGNPSMVDRRDFQKELDQQAKPTQTVREGRAKRKSSTSPSTSRAEKPKMERHKTEPAPVKRRASTGAKTRPTVRKSTTSTKVSDIKATDVSAEKDNNRRSESTTSAARPAKPQRTPSVFTSIFAKPPPPEKLVSCLTCGDDSIPVAKSAKLPCTHRMCHSCLKRIFKMSIKDPAHMPPRCCTEKDISLKHVESLFDDEFKRNWNRKFKEWTCKNRLYCPKKGCGEWIQPKHMHIQSGRKVGTCPKCKFTICAICNQRAHRSRECPLDPSIKQLSEIAEQKGWRRCYNCRAMVELKEGCNHMSCRCLAEFCMCCGAKWKSCDCPWFNYDQTVNVQDLGGDPVRYQQELDRRREQMRRDEEMARQMAGLGVQDHTQRPGRIRGGAGDPAEVEIGNMDGRQLDANFLQQAREALAANYQNAELAARGLLGGWLTGRENAPAGLPGDLNQQLDQLLQQQQPDPLQARLGRRRTYRVRHAGVNTS